MEPLHIAHVIAFGMCLGVVRHCQLDWPRQSKGMTSYAGFRFPPNIISHAVWLYYRFGLSFRDVDPPGRRGDVRGHPEVVSAVRGALPRRLRQRRGRMRTRWHVDELFVTIHGRRQYLWRAGDEAGDVLDILVQARRNRHAAVRFFRKILNNQGRRPQQIITDQLRTYAAACRMVMPSVTHCTDRYANNRAAVSHQGTRQRERQMRRFKSPAHLQRFASVHSVVQNLFRVGRHLLRAVHYRLLRRRACVEWDTVTCAC